MTVGTVSRHKAWAMTWILKGLPHQYVFFYIDDVLIITPTFELHLQVLQQFLDWLRDFGMLLKAFKCEFLAEKMIYLGFEVSYEGLALEQQKCQKIQDWISPEAREELSSLLGFFTYYRRFVQIYSKKAYHLLYVKNATNKPFLWTEECKSTLLQLK